MLEARSEWSVCGEATTGLEAIDLARSLKPDVVILDLRMPELNGLEAAREIAKLVPAPEILILTVDGSEQSIRDVLDAGARGVVLKSDAGRDLVAAVDALRQHHPFFTSRVAELVLQEYLAAKRAASRGQPGRNSLTDRETQIVQLLTRGKSNKEVAGALNLSIKTVETHRSHIMMKLGLQTTADLVRFAVRNGLSEA